MFEAYYNDQNTLLVYSFFTISFLLQNQKKFQWGNWGFIVHQKHTATFKLFSTSILTLDTGCLSGCESLILNIYFNY